MFVFTRKSWMATNARRCSWIVGQWPNTFETAKRRMSMIFRRFCRAVLSLLNRALIWFSWGFIEAISLLSAPRLSHPTWLGPGSNRSRPATRNTRQRTCDSVVTKNYPQIIHFSGVLIFPARFFLTPSFRIIWHSTCCHKVTNRHPRVCSRVSKCHIFTWIVYPNRRNATCQNIHSLRKFLDVRVPENPLTLFPVSRPSTCTLTALCSFFNVSWCCIGVHEPWLLIGPTLFKFDRNHWIYYHTLASAIGPLISY